MRDFYMLLNVFRKVTCFAKRNFYKGFEAVAIVVSVIDACREKYYFRSRVLDGSVECRLSPEKCTATKKPLVFSDKDEKPLAPSHSSFTVLILVRRKRTHTAVRKG